MRHNKTFNFLPFEFKYTFQYYPPINFYFFQVNSFLYISPATPYSYERREEYICLIWEIDTQPMWLEINNCISQIFLKNSQPLSSVKPFPFDFDKAIFQYPAHNSKSLIAIVSHKDTVHIVTTKGIFRK